MKITKSLFHAGVLGLSLLASSVMAAVPAAEADKLGKSLTPMGAEMAGNADGSIPAWKPMPKNAGTVDSKGFLSDPFASEKPLFTITAQNVDQYKEKLAPGQYAMFKRYPETYKMPVYPSHRGSTVPDDVFAGVNLKPNVAWSHDVNGYSPGPGGNFEEGRKAVSLGVDAEYQNTYTASLAYTNFFDGKYTTVDDRDFVALSVGVNF